MRDFPGASFTGSRRSSSLSGLWSAGSAADWEVMNSNNPRSNEKRPALGTGFKRNGSYPIEFVLRRKE
ncbi:hypothetical protein PF003_g33992 [Phytophthora fragariae]|uniref:Sulfatase-modifying factor enzyme domain-containing protein n=1 Tax=Phytophthora fragariae TaxID=53985 RepID=A0A6A3EVR1_9STRA|nr:hypothetical protein PF003_g33992 [Phytophthora fragariae]KAE8937549.1 hypothetical protein PF009_g12551 [Phytophthora fragariae]